MTLNQFFVYGTLRQGNCRYGYWPHSPESIETAWVRGSLFDGPGYPAMRRHPANHLSEDKIQGELWVFREELVAEVTQTLDRIEGTNQAGMPNLYDRILVPVFDLKNRSLGNTWAYEYAIDPIVNGFKRIKATEVGGVVQWIG